MSEINEGVWVRGVIAGVDRKGWKKRRRNLNIPF